MVRHEFLRKKENIVCIKEVTKSYFTHYTCVFIVLFNTALCRSAFFAVSFGKLAFRPSVLRHHAK